MKPLLNIKTVPIAIEYKVTRASLQHKSQAPTVNISRQRGGFNMQRQPAKVNIDQRETHASIGLKNYDRSISEFAEAGKQAGFEATRKYAENGNRIVDSHGKGEPIADIAMENRTQTPQLELTFLPSAPPQMSVEGGTLEMQYTMDRLTFDWNINHKPFLEYIPGNIEFTVTQYPDVVIEYVGEPIYVPPSANPNYEPPPDIDRSV